MSLFPPHDALWENVTFRLLAEPDEVSRALILGRYPQSTAAKLRTYLDVMRQRIAAGLLTPDELDRIARGTPQ